MNDYYLLQQLVMRSGPIISYYAIPKTALSSLLVVGRCGGCTVSARGCASPGNMRSPDGASSWMVGLTSVARPVVPTICQHTSHHYSMPQQTRYIVTESTIKQTHMCRHGQLHHRCGGCGFGDLCSMPMQFCRYWWWRRWRWRWRGR